MRLIRMGFVGVLLALIATPARAHDPDVYIANYWQSDFSVNWHFTKNVPSSATLRDRIKDGANEWTAPSPIMHFNHVSGDYDGFPWDSCPGTYQYDAVHWNDIDGKYGVNGITHKCYTGINEIYTFQIKFDSSETWYEGTSASVPGTTVDMWSLAAHEFGHATGFSGPYEQGHFDPNADVCNGSPKATMCPFYHYGDSYYRSLEYHDKETFTNRYP